MCVAITLAPGTNLTLEEIRRMDRNNADGVGLAWAYDGHVSWWKTTKVDPQEVLTKMEFWSNFPRLMHFRLATAGGTRPDLCHPFEVGPLAACQPHGASQRVMIHNGHWTRWKEVHDLLDSEGLLPDKGPWSDTRLAAYLAHMDPDWLTALGGRVAVMDGDETIVRLGDWQELREGIYVSNKHWDTAAGYKRGGYDGYRSWKGWEWTEEERASFEKDAKTKPTELVSDTPDNSRKGHKHKEYKNGHQKNGSTRRIDPHAWQNPDNHKWYKYDASSGNVVEIAPPSEEGAASTSNAAGAGGTGEVAP